MFFFVKTVLLFLRNPISIFRSLSKTGSYCPDIQSLSCISTTSRYEYSHRGPGQLFEGKGHFDHKHARAITMKVFLAPCLKRDR